MSCKDNKECKCGLHLSDEEKMIKIMELMDSSGSQNYSHNLKSITSLYLKEKFNETYEDHYINHSYSEKCMSVYHLANSFTNKKFYEVVDVVTDLCVPSKYKTYIVNQKNGLCFVDSLIEAKSIDYSCFAEIIQREIEDTLERPKVQLEKNGPSLTVTIGNKVQFRVNIDTACKFLKLNEEHLLDKGGKSIKSFYE